MKTGTTATREFLENINAALQKVPLVGTAKRIAFHRTCLNVIESFPLFRPYSGGRYRRLSDLTLRTINQVVPFLLSLSEAINGEVVRPVDVEDFLEAEGGMEGASELKTFFDSYGSDKANGHTYHNLYAVILRDRAAVRAIMEIGIGTNSRDVIGSMGPLGRPGASLRAFRDFCPNARVYGADVDGRILFKEERIETFLVDQTNPGTFALLASRVPAEFDLIVDDGLHSPDANLATLEFAMTRLRLGGWAVIEDIAPEAVPLWKVVGAIVPGKYRPHLFRSAPVSSSSLAYMFAVQRVG